VQATHNPLTPFNNFRVLDLLLDWLWSTKEMLLEDKQSSVRKRRARPSAICLKDKALSSLNLPMQSEATSQIVQIVINFIELIIRGRTSLR
jgi:hypothetical protein